MTFDVRIDYIGNQPVYWFTPSYVHYDLPFMPYRVSGQGWSGEVNVSAALYHLYTSRIYDVFSKTDGERLAVAITAWGELRDRLGAALDALCARHGREAVRDQFIRTLHYERMF